MKGVTFGKPPPTDVNDHLKAFLAGEISAFAPLKKLLEPLIKGKLSAAGALPDEAEAVLEEIWNDCLISKSGEKPTLLARFRDDQQAKLSTWLSVVALNRWLNLKRRQGVHQRWLEREKVTHPADQSPLVTDHALADILREAIQSAFDQCDAEALVLLRLVFLHGLSQRELAATWKLSESALSRRLDRTMKQISEATIGHIRQTDPWLELRWEDFLELCQEISGDADANSSTTSV
ncbi:MAG: sigma-70 family RNA polymerase sigma factor [Verrucomicrobiota bacterium]